MRHEIEHALAQFREWRQCGQLDDARTSQLAFQAADRFLAYYHDSKGYLAEAIRLLCEILYDRLFAQVVTYCRRLPAGSALDAELKRFGLFTEDDLLARKEKLKTRASFPREKRQAVRKVFVPSRVTLGADVAVTSVVVAKAKDLFAAAEIVLLALPRTAQLFRGDGRVRFHPVAYERSGDLISRLNAWLDVLSAIEAEKASLRPGEYLVIDPDSRLTQLGIFPLVEDETAYHFFESRGYRRPGRACISELTAAWLEECFGGDSPAGPYLSLSQDDVSFGERFRERLRGGGAEHIVVINLGVGGNDRKRAGDAFEGELLLRLIAAGSCVVLAKGVGRVEVGRAERAANVVKAGGGRVVDAPKRDGAGAIQADLVSWQGEIGAYCGLIGAADMYVGYDSAGQHIAAALGVPTIDIFVDHSYPLIAVRWRPCGPGVVKVVEAGPEWATGGAGDVENLLAQVMACYYRIRASDSLSLKGSLP